MTRLSITTRLRALCTVAAIAAASALISPASATSAATEELFATSFGFGVGFGSACATTADDDLWCWGLEWDGGLANGTGGDTVAADGVATTPVLSPLSGVTETSGNCALLEDGEVRCWGFDGVIEDGEGSLFSDPPWGTSTPTDYGFDPAAQLAGTCARLIDGGVQCYGWDRFGHLGSGGPGWPGTGFALPPPSSAAAVDVLGLDDVVDLTHTQGLGSYCALESDGAIYCWGLNNEGQLGNGESGSAEVPCPSGPCVDGRYESTPIQVLGIDDAVDVEQNCAIREGGVVSCWGQNTDNRFDLGAATDQVFAPIEISAFAGARDLAVDRGRVCAVLASGDVVCQGSRDLGDGSADVAARLATVPFESAREIDFGQGSACVRSADGSIACWGANFRGHLGVGTDDPVNAPRNVVMFGGGGTPPPSMAQVESLEPGRVLDTRATGETVDGDDARTGRVAADTFIELDILGRAAVPSSEVSAVVLNVTAINPAGRGFVTAYPCGDRPTASSLNYGAAGVVIANEVIAKLSATGTICLYTSAEAHLAADVVGFLPSDSEIVSLDPGRFLDSRSAGETIDDVSQALGRIAADSFVEVQLAGRGAIPASGASAAVVNITAINPAGRGFVTAYPCGDRPTASSLNFAMAGDVVANELVAKLSPTGSLCLYTSAETDLAADVVGYVPTSSNLASFDPGRLLDTREAGETVDGRFLGEGRIPADTEVELEVTGRGTVPSSGVSAAILNITAINPAGRGFVTAYPCGERPTASSLNYSGAGGVIANELVAKLSATGTLCLYSSEETHLAADIVGFVPG